jgi:hypothetical protein
MKKTITLLLFTSLILAAIPLHLQAEIITKPQAASIARNWVSFIIRNTGDWGGAPTASIYEVVEFKHGDRLLGYFCPAEPQGFVLVSLLRELPPVKGYSTSSDLDPNSDEGPANLFKMTIKNVLDQVEARVGPIDKAKPEDLAQFLGTGFRTAWTEIENGVDMNYQAGDTLVNTYWRQGDPYNTFCPAPPVGDDCTAPRCLVGCVATAGSQIMRYWCWPPYGVGFGWNDPYDWVNMPVEITTGSLQAEIDAVAELCYEVGVADGMTYCGNDTDGCQSGAPTDGMADVYVNVFRYAQGTNHIHREDYTAVEWFQAIKDQLNLNRPVQYHVEGHSILGDGWQEIGGVPLRQYHMNYGWADEFNAWYTLDSLHKGGIEHEYIVRNIVPINHLGAVIAGTYQLEAFPYRYFDLDAVGNTATFEAGQYLQSLPRKKVSCAIGNGNNIRFQSSSSDNTRLFTRGDITKGARLQGGAIKIHPTGSLKLF